MKNWILVILALVVVLGSAFYDALGGDLDALGPAITGGVVLFEWIIGLLTDKPKSLAAKLKGSTARGPPA